MSNKTRCSMSIKQLITSTEQRLLVDSTVDERFDDVLSEIVIHRGVHGFKSDEGSDHLVEHMTLVYPYAFIESGPEGFDMSKSNVFEMDDLTFRHEYYSQCADNMLKDNFDYSSCHNNLVESKLLGRAVYSWCQGGKFDLIRQTDSKLPKGIYNIRFVLIIINATKRLGFSEYISADISTPFVKDVRLSLVKKDAPNSKNAGSKKKVCGAENKRESPIEEHEIV